MVVKITLAETQASDADVRFECEACQHTTVLPSEALIARHGAAARLDQLEKAGRCSRCGSRRRGAVATHSAGRMSL